MKAYLDTLRLVKEKGFYKSDRTGTGTYSYFGHQIRFDLSKGFPLVTTKKLHIRAIIHELLWFIKGETNIKYLTENNVTIWDEWATDKGDLGPVYGEQWRSWRGYNGETIDQLANIINEIKTNPDSRRLIVSAWNPAVLPDPKKSPKQNAEECKQALPPCHTLFQFYVIDGKLSCQLYQRSADLFLGVPFNIASYALLTYMIAHICNLEVGDFIHTFGDLHIYKNHVEQVDLQLSREELELPTLHIKRKVENINDFVYEDFEILNYKSHPAIKAPVAI